ncbi:hypothetical protein JTB14_017887 [Gonioctena quinquepunctata]|nr:hypothetical protein JTB14_017887 [Gonioctena quinquepunctata]
MHEYPEDPVTLEEALSYYNKEQNEELRSLNENIIWELVDSPQNRRIIERKSASLRRDHSDLEKFVFIKVSAVRTVQAISETKSVICVKPATDTSRLQVNETRKLMKPWKLWDSRDQTLSHIFTCPQTFPKN